MQPPSIPVKTAQGQAELSHRTLRLSQRHRTVLLLVDGRRSLDQVLGMAQQAGAPQSCVDELMSLGLITLAQPTLAMTMTNPRPAVATTSVAIQIDLPLDVAVQALPATASAESADDSELPASRTLQPESVFSDSVQASLSTTDSELMAVDAAGADEAMEEARDILLRAVRAEAPLAGSLTMLRLRRAASRADLEALLDEVESRIAKSHRTLAAQLTLRRVRVLLGSRVDSVLSTF